MKSFFYALVLVTISTPLLSQPESKITGNRILKTEYRKVESFRFISIDGFFNVEETEIEPGTLKIEAESNVLPYVLTEIKGDSLIISLTKGQSIQNMLYVKVGLPVNQLEGVKVGSFGSFSSGKSLHSPNFNIEVGFKSSFTSELYADHLTMKLGSVSNVKLSGKSDSSDITMSSRANLDGNKFTSDVCTISLHHESMAYLNVNREIRANTSNKSKLQYVGNPRIEELNKNDGVIEKITRIN